MNETLNNTITSSLSGMQSISFEDWTKVTASPQFLIAIGSAWLICIIIYLIVGAVARGRSSSGQVLSKRMIEFPNFWFAMIIFFFILPALILGLVIFPLWMKILGG